MSRVRTALTAARDEQTRWPALDGIRGMAIAAVVAYHALKIVGGWTSGKVRADGLDWWWWPLGAGRLGVDVFFVLSGFLLWFAWKRLRARHPSGVEALGAYARGRAIRILPPYYLMLAVYIPLIAPELLQTTAGLWDTFLFVTVQQYNEPALPGRVNVALWTQTVEVQFYVVLPLVVLLIRRLRPLAPLIAALVLSLWWADNRGMYPDSFIVGRLVQFVAGMAVAAAIEPYLDGAKFGLARALADRRMAWGLGALAAVIALYHGQLLGLPHRGGPDLDRWVHPVLGVLLAALMAHVVLSPRHGKVMRAFERPTPRLLGHLSYGVYLWHFPIYDRLLDWTGGAGAGLADGGALVGLACATALTVAASVASYAYLERPLLTRKPRSSVTPEDGSARDGPSPGNGATPTAGER